MKHNLQFVKISPQHEIAGVGFAGNIFIILNALTYINDGDKLHIDMESYECISTEKDVVLHDTNNSWEYYFEQTPLIDGEEVNQMNSLMAGNLTYENREVFMHPENFVWLKNKFYDNFKIKPYLQQMLDDYYNQNIKDKVTLGVQVRLTDMKHYHNVSPLESYVVMINAILAERPEIEQIFLATDDGVVITKLREIITSVPILCYEDMFRADEVNKHLEPYDRLHSTRELHRYKIGIECVQEIFTLAKCDYLLKADISSVSIVASILSDNIKQVYKL